MIGLLYRIIIGRFKEKTWFVVDTIKVFDRAVSTERPVETKYILQCKETGEIKHKRV